MSSPLIDWTQLEPMPVTRCPGRRDARPAAGGAERPWRSRHLSLLDHHLDPPAFGRGPERRWARFLNRTVHWCQRGRGQHGDARRGPPGALHVCQPIGGAALSGTCAGVELQGTRSRRRRRIWRDQREHGRLRPDRHLLLPLHLDPAAQPSGWPCGSGGRRSGTTWSCPRRGSRARPPSSSTVQTAGSGSEASSGMMGMARPMAVRNRRRRPPRPRAREEVGVEGL